MNRIVRRVPPPHVGDAVNMKNENAFYSSYK